MAKRIIPIGKASIGIKCGDCIHFKRMSKFEKPCNDLGRKHFADAPDCYSPDVYALAKHSPEILFNLALLYKDFTAQQTRVFMSLLKKSKTFEKSKLQFGMPVYFRIGNEDFLSNYYRGFVLDVTSSAPQSVFITSDLGAKQRKQPMIGTFLRESVFSVTEFKKKKAALQKAGKLVATKPTFSCTKSKTALGAADYQPPSMDDAPREWFDKTKAKGKDKKKGSKIKAIDGTLEFKI